MAIDYKKRSRNLTVRNVYTSDVAPSIKMDQISTEQVGHWIHKTDSAYFLRMIRHFDPSMKARRVGCDVY